MNVELTQKEAELLKELLHREISDIGPEIRHTRTPSYRDELKEHKVVLRELYQKFATIAPPAQQVP